MRYTLSVALAAAAASAPALAEPAAEIATGVEIQEGDYFTGERVEILTVQNVLRARAGRASFAVSLPWHRIEAPGNVVGGGGLLGLPIVSDPTRPATRERREGIGDLRIGAGYTVPAPGGVELTLNGQAKLPTASADRGIGTGETDVTVGAEAARRIGAVTPYVSVGYTMPGDPEAYDLRNAVSARGGVALRLSPSVRGNVSYGYAESVSPLVPDEQQVSTRLNANLSRSLSLGLYGNAGLSSGSPDIGAGISLGFRIF
jgi:hypothetical protein